jgi:hypothetical protein
VLLKRALQLGFTITIAELHLDEIVFVEAAHVADAHVSCFCVHAYFTDDFLAKVFFALEWLLHVL